MQMDDFTSNGMVRRWSLVDGQARCVEDAIDANAAGALAALQKNAAVRALIGPVEAYEAAAALVARGEPDNGQAKRIPDPEAVRPEDAPDDWTAPLIDNPEWALAPRTIEQTTPEGDTVEVANPLWAAYDAAAAEVETAPDLTKALARWRAAEANHGSPEETVAEDDEEAAGQPWEADRDAVLAALETAAAQPLAVDPRPIKESISRRQFAAACATLGLMTPTEALAFVTTNATPAILAAAIAQVPEQQRFGVQLSVAGSMTFERSNPATIALMDLVAVPQGYPNAAAVRDAIWRLGATFP